MRFLPAGRRVLALLGVLVLGCGAAWAGNVGACTSFTTVSALMASGGPNGAGNYCTLGDVHFLNFADPHSGDSPIPDAWGVTFTEIGNSYVLTLTENNGDVLQGATSGPTDFELAFTVALPNAEANAGDVIAGGSLSGIVTTNTKTGNPPHGGDATLKLGSGDLSVSPQTLSSPYSGETDFTFQDLNSVRVWTGVTVHQNESASGITVTDTFIEGTPEPASFALLGTGLAALGWTGLRRARGNKEA